MSASFGLPFLARILEKRIVMPEGVAAKLAGQRQAISFRQSLQSREEAPDF